MKNKFKNIFIVIASVFVSACCSKEYIAGVYLQPFIFLDATTGDNLLFGANRIFNADSVFIKCDNETEYKKITESTNLADTVIYLNFNNANTCFIKFPDSDIDTFAMQYVEREARNQRGICRQSYMDMINLRYNNITISVGGNPIKIYK